MTTSTPPTNEPTFAFDNGEILYDNIDVLQDDYFKLLHHMKINGETVVPLWVFRSFCESYASFLQKVSKGSKEEDCSAQDSNFVESQDRGDGEIQENDLMVHGAHAVGLTKEAVSQHSEHSSTYVTDIYQVLINSVPITSMDLSNKKAMLRVAQELINCNKWVESSSQTTDHILYVRWLSTTKPMDGRFGGVCIGFTRLELAQKAVYNGINWAGKSRTCSPWANGHKLHQCTKCMCFGHSSRDCRNKQRCPDCGLEHLETRCQPPSTKTCIFCSGPHPTRSLKCPQRMNEMMKAGFWPLKIEVVNPTGFFRYKSNSGLQGRTEFQPQHQSDAPIGISKATEHFPDLSNLEKILEHLNGLRALVLASRSTLSTATSPMQNKRKTQALADGASGDFPMGIPKRLKGEEVQVKQKEKKNVTATNSDDKD